MVRKKNSNGATLGFEETLWQAADKMRGHMDPSEYARRSRTNLCQVYH